MNKFLSLIVAFACGAVHADSTAWNANEFRAKREIVTSAAGPVYEMELSEGVYRQIVRDDMGDLRVVNAAGEPVPHALEFINDNIAVAAKKTAAIPFFPITGNSPVDEGNSEIVLTENAQGRVLQVRQKGGSKEKEKSTGSTVGYLLDLRKETSALKQLTLDWNPSERDGLFQFDLYSSDDLRSWQPVELGVTLAKLSYQGQALEKNALELSSVRAKFLRLSWSNSQRMEIKGFSGEFLSSDSVELTRRQLEVKASGSDKDGFYFERPPFPSDRIHVVLPEINTLVRFTLYGRSTEKSPWSHRVSGTAYRIQQEGGELRSDPVKTAAHQDRYWRLQIEGKEARLGKEAPSLNFGWIAHKVFFLARGNGPFALLYGHPKLSSPDFGFTSLLSMLPNEGKGIKLLAAKLAEAETLQIPVSPVVPNPEFPWKKYLLWSALVLVLVISSLMAWRLYAELNKAKPPGT